MSGENGRSFSTERNDETNTKGIGQRDANHVPRFELGSNGGLIWMEPSGSGYRRPRYGEIVRGAGKTGRNRGRGR